MARPAQCSSSVVHAQRRRLAAVRLPGPSKYLAGRAVNGMLLSENRITPTNAASTICDTVAP